MRKASWFGWRTWNKKNVDSLRRQVWVAHGCQRLHMVALIRECKHLVLLMPCPFLPRNRQVEAKLKQLEDVDFGEQLKAGPGRI